MQEIEQQLLQASAKVFRILSEIPTGDERTVHIEMLEQALDSRGMILNQLLEKGIRLTKENSSHKMLLELDLAIQERLNSLMDIVKQDMKNVQSSKKNEERYINPYSSVRVMDGKYYDQKK